MERDNQNNTPEPPDESKLNFFKSQSEFWGKRADETMSTGHISDPEALRNLIYQVSTQAAWDHEAERESVRLGYHACIGISKENVKYYL